MSKPNEYPVKGKSYFAWEYEEQTQMKHKVLGAYSKIWISKLGSRSDTLFIDCHGGCGAYMFPDGRVSYGSSFIVRGIADEISQKRKYRTGIYYCEKSKKYYNNFLKVKTDLGDPKIATRNNCFEDVIKDPSVIKNYQKYPTLFLVDPFGYNFDISVLSGLMNSFGNELIVNFMFDYITRFLSFDNVENALNTFFGTDEWKKAKSLSGTKREEYLVNLFKKQLKIKTGAKFIFPYRLCYPDKDQTYYYLFHATNHIDGITLMKDAFSSLNNGRVQYLGKKNNDFTFFDLDYLKAGEIYSSFLEQRKGLSISVDDLWFLIVEDTAYTKKDLNKALVELVQSNKISITRVSSKRGSYREKDIVYVI